MVLCWFYEVLGSFIMVSYCFCNVLEVLQWFHEVL